VTAKDQTNPENLPWHSKQGVFPRLLVKSAPSADEQADMQEMDEIRNVRFRNARSRKPATRRRARAVRDLRGIAFPVLGQGPRDRSPW